MSKVELQAAIKECLQLSADCSKGPHGPIATCDVSAVTDMSQLFDQSILPNANNFVGCLSNWDVSGVTNMLRMFYRASSFNGDISRWNVYRVTNMQDMFASASLFDVDLSRWDLSRVTNMIGMFASASSFNGDISKWDVSRVTNMLGMFASASSFNGDISKWDVSRVTTMNIMFKEASSFKQTLCGAWLTSRADKYGMFHGSSGQICSMTTSSASTSATVTTLNSKITSMKAPPLASTFANSDLNRGQKSWIQYLFLYPKHSFIQL